MIEEPNMSIWFSGKEMLRGKTLKDYVGKNEKTKIVAKLQKVILNMRKMSSGLQTRSYTNRPVNSQKNARSLKF